MKLQRPKRTGVLTVVSGACGEQMRRSSKTIADFLEKQPALPPSRLQVRVSPNVARVLRGLC